MPKMVKLSAPLVTHKGPVEEIELRDMTARDMVKMRVSPLSFITLGDQSGKPLADRKADQRFEVRYDIVMDYAIELSGIDAILLGAMPASDFRKVSASVIDMWNDAQGE